MLDGVFKVDEGQVWSLSQLTFQIQGSHVRDHYVGIWAIPANCNYGWIQTGILHKV